MAAQPPGAGAYPPEVTDWWRTSISDIAPGRIRLRGYAVEELIGRVDFPSTIWLLLRGELPTADQAGLLGAALVAAVDHGPQAPSIAIARMAATCGVGVNNAMASAINALGDVHGGAGEQCMALLGRIADAVAGGTPAEAAVEAAAGGMVPGGRVPGFGHRFHPVDPRAPRLLELVRQGVEAGWLSGRHAAAAAALDAWLERRAGRRVPMNVDGATAVVLAELGFPPPLGRGLFVLSRSVGILAHAWEQQQQGARIKGPLPPSVPYRYEGPAPRALPEGERR